MFELGYRYFSELGVIFGIHENLVQHPSNNISNVSVLASQKKGVLQF